MPAFGTLKDRYNKACGDLRGIDEFHVLDLMILLETIYHTWGNSSRAVLANLPAPIVSLSSSADEIYKMLCERNGQLLPPD